MLVSRSTKLRARFAGLFCANVTLALATQGAFALDGLEVTGINTDHGMNSAGGNLSMAREHLCAPGAGGSILGALSGLQSRIGPRLASGAGIPMPSMDDVSDVMNKLCTNDNDFSSEVFTIIYAECRMTMDSAGQMLDIVLPVSGADGRMDAVDFGTREVMRVVLNPALRETADAIGGGWSSNIDMTEQGSGGTLAGHGTTKYAFNYSGGLGGGGSLGAIAGMVSTTSSGTAWIASQVDGIEIVRAFYQNISSEVDASQGAGSFMSGLISNLVGMLEKGIPLKMDQMVESKVAGMSMAAGRTEMEVYSVDRMSLPRNWCEQDFIPAGFRIRDVNEEISEAMSGAGMGSGRNTEMSESMQQYQKAMEGLTPEQKAMMEKMGMGNLQEMMGGAAPASPPAAAAPSAPARSQSASSPSSSSAGADPYYSDNVTQMVQRQLKALGYDPGTTDGTDSMQTSIAISQFQAENNMKVTGKASPQLAGVLSARLSNN